MIKDSNSIQIPSSFDIQGGPFKSSMIPGSGGGAHPDILR